MAQRQKKKSKPRRLRKRRRRVTNIGAAPGTLHVDPQAAAPTISVMTFDADTVAEPKVANAAALPALLGKGKIVWVNVDGLGDEATLRNIAEVFKIHPLTLEDIAHTHQRPKMERFDDYVYIVLRMVSADEDILDEQMSIVVGSDFVVTFQERVGDCLDPLRERIRTATGRVRRAGADYLAYAIIDNIIDRYFPLLESYGDRIDDIEARVIEQVTSATLHTIYTLKKDLRSLRRSVWPLRDMLSALTREGGELFTHETLVYMRDGIDHAVQLIEAVEANRDAASALMDLQLSTTGNRMNEVMKVLTIIATIFIPLSFIAGVYGMNFEPKASRLNMPELGWTYGYPFALSLMLAVAVGLLLFFRRKGWLGEPSRDDKNQDD